ncbi:imipenem/basic amino acid-specific outer membrane pore [Halopseudomonas litoralis]|uniref:Imipenem/basic amino acid-specific outer membrane pore n=1 Tax=Halopseudomonas litoralis TaxID=797277 RepID=A0A1H1MG96_9GAMM|nr:OprD family porin [Halopseudomonas litoralis]SDR85642.1 imipenem/basic amino acid-specific outer membrane pore [Halopseudomonas litoralis]
MKNTVKWSSVALAVAMGNGLIATQAVAQGEGFVEGATATLESRTLYFNRDYRDPGQTNQNGSMSRAEEAATGFRLNFQSGYTQGPVGLGADVLALAGIKLDSSGGHNGRLNMLPTDSNGDTVAEYAEIRGAVKANIAGDTTLRYGVHLTENPVINYEDARLLPNHYFGYSIANTSIDGLFVEAGRMTDRGEMGMSSQREGAFVADEDQKVDYLGGTYEFADTLSASLYTSKAEDLWKRHFAGIAHTAELANDMSLTTDLSYYKTSDDSSAATDFDNDAASLAFTLGAGFHDLTVAYQRMSGDAGFEYFDAGIYLANSIQVLDFNAKDERSWQARYDYDFEGVGIPGLTFMTRYITGDNIDSSASARDSRWERDTDIRYTVQRGFLQGVNLVWRNATVRQHADLGGDIDENRLIASYTWNLL